MKRISLLALLLATVVVSLTVPALAQVPTPPQPTPPTGVPSTPPVPQSSKPGSSGTPTVPASPGTPATPAGPGTPAAVPASPGAPATPNAAPTVPFVGPPSPTPPVVTPEIPSGAEVFSDEYFPEQEPFRGEGFPGKQHYKEVLEKFRDLSVLGGLDNKKLLEWFNDWNKRYDKREAEITSEEGSDKACREALADLHQRFSPIVSPDPKTATGATSAPSTSATSAPSTKAASAPPTKAASAPPTKAASTSPTKAASAPPTAVASEIELANDPRLQELLMLQVRKYDQYIVPAKADPNQQPAKGDVGIGLGHRLWEEWAVAKAHEGTAWKDYVAKFRVISADHPCYIVEVVAGSPSAIAGVPEHAILSHIDGHPIDGKLLKDATEMLVGPPGSTVELTVQGLDKDGKRLEEKKYKVVRNGYHKPAVRFKDLGNGVAYLRIDSFIEAPDGGPSVVAEFKIALQELVKKGFTKVVFDVRDNPGGRVDFCLDMLEWVLPTGYAVTQLERKDDYLLRSTVSFTRDLRLVTKPSKDRKSFEFDCTQRELILPETTAVVVLTNGNTASCGELFSLALKYNHRAETIGTTTHGKGITQAVTKVRDRELHVTNSFFNPADVFTNGIGGKPDLEVEKSLSEIDNQLAAAVIRVTEIHQRDVDAGAAREKEISAGYQRNKTLWAPAPHQPQDKK